MIGYETDLGQCICGDSLEIINSLEDNSIDLILTSPPFSLATRHKQYSNFEEIPQDQYVEWLLQWGYAAYSKLKDTGSFVIDLGGAYERGRPVRSLYQYEFILRMCKEVKYNLCQDVYWYNNSSLPLPIQYTNNEHIRLKSSVNLELWFSKSDRQTKANNQNVLVEYSDRMQKFLNNKQGFIKYEGETRPSGNTIQSKTWSNKGGAIPSNMLQYSNSSSNDNYLRTCRDLIIKANSSRMPIGLAEFWIKFLTTEGDKVVDIFSGSNTTGKASENLNRQWLSIDISPHEVATSSFRFCEYNLAKSSEQYNKIINGCQVNLKRNIK